MKIPNFNDTKVIDKDGKFSEEWAQIMQTLFTQMSKNLSDEGIKAPQQKTSTIAKLNTPLSTGALVYDQDTNQMKVNINGVFKVIPVMP